MILREWSITKERTHSEPPLAEDETTECIFIQDLGRTDLESK